MNVNLLSAWEYNLKSTAEAFVNVGFKREDYQILTNHIANEFKLTVGLGPALLFHSFKKKEGLYLWVKCEFSVFADKFGAAISNLLTLIKSNKLGMNPFYDEDAYRNYFTQPKTTNSLNQICSFYLNPDIPEGTWENHTI